MGAASGAAWADAYKDGMTAFQSEDYAKALSLLLPYLEPAQRERVLAAAAALGALKRLVEDEVAPALNVSIGFSDADGD